MSEPDNRDAAMQNDLLEIVAESPWLACQPGPFRQRVLARGTVRAFKSGSQIYALGDEPGGIYCIVDGEVAISIAPGEAAPKIAHLASTGSWFGEGAFLTGEPRRVGLKAVGACTLFHLPLNAMEQLAVEDPVALRRFGQIAMMNLDLALQVIDDLLIPDTERRIAATLLRCFADRTKATVTQADLARLSNAPRQTVNRVLGAFADRGWIEQGYGAIKILEQSSLAAVVSEDH